ncbi:hypothetical protein FEO87_12480 [Stenotrophomonas maltophilia]|nr:hypothetical protein FEO87_12480 [Stenotrophomonas maltophilia]
MIDVPRALQATCTELQQRLGRIDNLSGNGERSLVLEGELLRFPYRIYADAADLFRLASHLQGDARALCLCLLSRHCDGHVRQRAIETLGPSPMPWVHAFHLALLGEYVDEIASTVAIQARHTGLQRYAALISENHAFFDLCRQRAASYWDAYYRARYSTLRLFPAHRLLLQMANAARSP